MTPLILGLKIFNLPNYPILCYNKSSTFLWGIPHQDPDVEQVKPHKKIILSHSSPAVRPDEHRGGTAYFGRCWIKARLINNFETMNKNIQEIKTKDLIWVNVSRPGKKEIKYLKEKYKFHNLDLKDCLPPLQRTKLVENPDYLFMILQFPIFDKQTREIKSSEVDFFINQNTLVTVHSNELDPLKELFKLCQENLRIQEKYLVGNPGILIYEILNRSLLHCFPMLNYISLNIDKVEKKIFNRQEKEMVKDILIVKSNIVNFRKIMQAHKTVIRKLIEKAPQFFSIAKLNLYFNDLIAHTKEIWDDLENYKETIDALYNTNESLISFRLNKIIKTLTIFSVIVFPLTLLAAIFGMNTNNMPFVNFWYIILIMLVLTLIMAIFFKVKKWL